MRRRFLHLLPLTSKSQTTTPTSRTSRSIQSKRNCSQNATHGIGSIDVQLFPHSDDENDDADRFYVCIENSKSAI